MKLLIATRSDHKLREIRQILEKVPELEVLSLVDAGVEPDPAEDDLEPYDTFAENALSKARHFARKTGLPTAADDSGLEVDALGGRPGVRSKRYAPEDGPGVDQDDRNNHHLLVELEGTPDAARTARYVCVVAWIDAEGRERHVRGTLEGRIATAPDGDGGFGYDPLFYVPDFGGTLGTIAPERKNAVSHRGEAFRALATELAR